MSQYALQPLHGVAELRDSAAAWDELWRRCPTAPPVCQAEPIALWCEALSQGQVAAVAVVDGARWVAALPLVPTRWGKVIPIAGAPSDPWSITGDFLLDESSDVPAVVDTLVAGLAQLGWPLLRLEFTPYETPRWQALTAALRRHDWQVDTRESYQIGQFDIPDNWQAYLAERSGNHRRHLRKAYRRASGEGELRLRVIEPADAAEVESLLRLAADIEERGWKGAAGTALARSPRVFRLLCRQTQALAARGQLRVVLLEFNGQPIAYELGMLSRGMFYAAKVGYDERFASYSPGQLLRSLLYEQWSVDRSVEAVDYWGMLTDATAKWITRSYPVGTFVAAAPSPLGRSIWLAETHLRRVAKRLKNYARRKQQPPSTVHPDATEQSALAACP
jgi:CelD/BcsL family acetyltransferase involved in cellulose biosynthesis